jgi:hypothetical protein
MRVAAIALTLLSISGCSLVLDPGRHMGESTIDAGVDSSTPTDGDVPDVTPLVAATVCRRLVALYCTGRAECCPSDPTCNESELLDNCDRWVGPAVTAPNVNYDPIQGALLLEEAEASLGTCGTEILHLLADRDGLMSTFRGVFGLGEMCEAGIDDLLIAAIVRPFTCTEGLACLEEGTSGSYSCTELVPLEAECVPFECAGDAYCGEVSGMTQCAPRLPDTTSCTRPKECESLYCDATGHCREPSSEEVWCFDPFDFTMPMR